MNETQIAAVFSPKKSFLKGMWICVFLLVFLVLLVFAGALMELPAGEFLGIMIILILFDIMAIFLFGIFYLGSKSKIRKTLQRSDIEIIKNELRKENTQIVLGGKMYLTDRYIIAFPSGQPLILSSNEIMSLSISRIKQKGIVTARFLNARTTDGKVHLILNERNKHKIEAVMQVLQTRYPHIA